jgi:hypothetical protein
MKALIAELLGARLERMRGGSYLFSIWLICLAILGRSLLDSWHFPWYGNPDQDLVFLRDGIRLWNGNPPGYGDHPGFMQMIVVDISIGCLGLLAKVFPSAASFDPIRLVDADWQGLFLFAKSVNTLLVSLVLTLCSALLVRWLGRSWTLLWAVVCAASMGLTVEIYQLRNEFFSSFFVIAAMLLSVNNLALLAGSCPRQVPLGKSVLLRVGLASWACMFFVVMGLLAKVQVLPILLVFLIVAPLLGFRLLGSRWLIDFAVAFSALFVCLSIFCAGLSAGLPIERLQGSLVIAAICGPPAIVLSSNINLRRCEFFGRTIGPLFVVVGCAGMGGSLLAVAKGFGWLGLVLNPLAVRTYAAASNACHGAGPKCLLDNSLKGFVYLFERSIDGYGLVILVASLVVIAWLASLARGSVGIFVGMNYNVFSYELAACTLIGVAFSMAFLAGQRWSVDHYLPYQQPYLFAGIFMLARGLSPWAKILRGIAFAIALSVLLIFMRYPDSSRQTYVKQVLEPGSARSAEDGGLCASQHQGNEWRNSSIWVVCNGFSR